MSGRTGLKQVHDIAVDFLRLVAMVTSPDSKIREDTHDTTWLASYHTPPQLGAFVTLIVRALIIEKNVDCQDWQVFSIGDLVAFYVQADWSMVAPLKALDSSVMRPSISENLTEIFQLVPPDSSKEDAGSDPDLLSRSARLMSLAYGIASGSGDLRSLPKSELQTYPCCEIAALATVVAAAAAVQEPARRRQCLTILELITEIRADLPPLTYQPLYLLEDDELLSARERGLCERLLNKVPLPA